MKSLGSHLRDITWNLTKKFNCFESDIFTENIRKQNLLYLC